MPPLLDISMFIRVIVLRYLNSTELELLYVHVHVALISSCSKLVRELLALPVILGGKKILNPVTFSSQCFKSSKHAYYTNNFR